MNPKLILLLLGLIIPSSLYAISTNADALQATLPPTKAFYNIFTDNKNIQADNYAGNLTLKAGDNIDITSNHLNDTITISASLPPGTGNATELDDLGDVILTGPTLDEVLQYNGTYWTNQALTAGGNATNFNDLGDVSLSSVASGHIVQVVNGYWQNKLFKANSITCSGNDKLSAYDNQTGLYTCSTDQQGLTTAITSLNGDTTTAQTISGTPGNITITDTGAGTLQVNTAGNIATVQGAQTFLNKAIDGTLNTLTNIAQSSITNLVSDLASKQAKSEKNANSGYAGLGSNGRLNKEQQNGTTEYTTNKGVANGYPGLNSNGLLANRFLATNTNSSIDCLKGDRTWGSCSAGSAISKLNGQTASTQTITGTANHITITNPINATTNIDIAFKVNTKASANHQVLTDFSNATTSGNFGTTTLAVDTTSSARGKFFSSFSNNTGDFGTTTLISNTFTCAAGSFVSSYNNATGVYSCTTPSGVTSLASNITLAGVPAQDVNIWTIALTANSGNTISGVINAFTSVSGNAPRGAANLTAPSNADGYCKWTQVSTTSADAIDNLVLNTVLTGRATNTGETAWIAAANRPMPINFDCTIKAGASPGNLKIWLTPELSGATIGAKAGSFYIKTP